MNCYADRTTLKNRLGITGTSDDTELLKALVAASRLEDKYCQRFFYIQTATKYFDGSASPFFLPDDLLSISTFKLDEDGDATFECTLDTGDYFLYPLNEYPKTWIKSNPNGDYSSFASGVPKGIEIAGSWGYGNELVTPYKDSSTTTAEELDATETGVDVVSGAALAVGQTILVESEQMYIQAIATNTITVRRAMNGTTGASHVTSKAVYIYEYPEPITEACLIQTMRWWKRKDTAFVDTMGSPELGLITASKKLDPDVSAIVDEYKRKNI